MALHDVTASDGDRLLGLARAWARLGRVDRAIAQYDEVVAVRPDLVDAFVELVGLLGDAGDWPAIARRCATWIADRPDHASHLYSDRVHNLHIEALCRIGGIDLAFATYGLEQRTAGPVTLGTTEIVALIAVRNEALHLPYLLEHHRRLGVDRFLCIDNGSDDGSFELVLDQPDTIVWQTPASYRGANCGAAWFDLVLRRHTAGNWCLIVDADELFVYPGYEERTIHTLCADLDREGATAYEAIMLDLYGAGRLSEARYRTGQDPLEVLPYFDRAYYRLRAPFKGPRRNITNYWGGVRARIFGGAIGGYLLQKFPLFRYASGEVLMSGQHWLDRPTPEIARGRGALLHCKLDATFPGSAAEEAARMEHANRAGAYRQYADALTADPDPICFDPMHSVRYDGSRQLVALGVMRDGPPAPPAPVTCASVLIPRVPPPSAMQERPFWSVIVVAGPDDVRDPARLLAAIGAMRGGPPSEVAVVCAAHDPEGPRSLASLASGGPHAVTVAGGTQSLTDIDAVNVGLVGSCGTWVHVVGVDDAPPAEFYASMAAAISNDAAAIAVATAEPVRRGVDLDLALALRQIVARRELYEHAGGFVATIAAAAAWEAVQRLTTAGGTAPLAVATTSSYACAGRSVAALGFGEDVTHWLAAIDLARETLALADADVAALRDRCAVRAADLVRDDITRGRFASALATVSEVLRVPVSTTARDRLIAATAGATR